MKFIMSIQQHKCDQFDHSWHAIFQTQKKLQNAILLLPDKQRIVFNLKYFEEMPYEEMSGVLKTSVGALKASYHHAVKKIEDFISFDWWHYPLNLIIIPGAELQLVINYAVNSFDPTLIQQMLEKLAIILSRFAHIPPGEKITSLIPNIPGQTIDDHS